MTTCRTSGLKVCAVLGLALAFALVSSAKAEATLIGAICDDINCTGGGDIIVSDGFVGLVSDTSSITGIVAFSGSVGGLTFASNISQSTPALVQPSMDLSFVATGIGDAYLIAFQDNATVRGALFGTLNGNLSGAGTEQALIHTAPGTDTSTLILNTTPSFNATLTNPGASASPYQMAIAVHVTRTTPGTTTGDFLVMPVPDGGATISLLGLGLAGLAYLRRRHRAGGDHKL